MEDEGDQHELALLLNYQESTFAFRGVILKLLYKTIDEIDSDSFFIKIIEEDKPKAKGMIQANIISQIVMYIEDFAVFAESFRSGKNFYDLIGNVQEQNKIDLGVTIENFFKNLDNFSDKEICDIMSYVNPDEIDFGEDTTLIKKHIALNIKELRRMFLMFRDFSDTNHIVSKRLKHAGIPIIPGLTANTPGPNIFKNHDYIMAVAKGYDPALDVVPIPFSKQVMDAYHIIIHAIQTQMTDIVKNRIWCISRQMKKMIPFESYCEYMLTFEENSRLRPVVDKYISEHPIIIQESMIVHPYPKFTDSDVKWYLDLPKFMADCKERLDTWEKYKAEYNNYSNTKKE